MRFKALHRGIALFLALSLTTGCGKIVVTETQSVESTGITQEIGVTTESSSASGEIEGKVVQDNQEEEAKATEEARRKEEEAKASEEAQRKEEEAKAEEKKKRQQSFSMMYYLAITAEEIRTSKNNRLVLDDIYNSLLNDINPSAIDEITQDHLKNLRDIISEYQAIEIKRERLQYIYNQNKASAIRSAVPNPLAILSTTNSFDWKRLAANVAYTVVDSYNNFKKASESADQEFIMSGWELDDEEVETIRKNRDRAFDYMVDMVQEYDFDGLSTLNEEMIEQFAEICAIQSVPEKKRRLESEKKTYQLLGDYWLELADCYYQSNKYQECLQCVEKYKTLSGQIYRQDANYVRILPEAIVAAQQCYKGEQYISKISGFADDIIDNTKVKDWSTRYFTAEVYLDLYAKTNNKNYLSSAYDIIYNNVTVLLTEQRKLNEEYLADVKKEEVKEPDYKYLSEEEKKEKEKKFKKEKKEVEKYNKKLIEDRKTELPTLYEPFVINCDFLFSLAKEMNLSKEEKDDIDGILDEAFLTKPINAEYSFARKPEEYPMELTKEEICIPVELLSEGATIAVSITDGISSQTFDDCVVSKVERKERTIDTFIAHVTSKQYKKYDWNNNSVATVLITYSDDYGKTLEKTFTVTEYEKHWYGDKVVFGEK